MVLVLALVAGLAAVPGAIGPSGAAEGETVLPTLPLPDCASNSLAPTDDVDCEGSVVNFYTKDTAPKPDLDDVVLSADTRTLDFRLAADRGSVQDIVFTWNTPGVMTTSGPSGTTFTSLVNRLWPDTINSTSATVEQRTIGGEYEEDNELRLVRQQDCGAETVQCRYRVDWTAYAFDSDRTRQELIWRIGLGWDLTWRDQYNDGSFDGCPLVAPVLVGGCLAGGGGSYVTFRSSPPPPLVAVATARRLGPAQFEFTGEGSGPDVVEWNWFQNNVPEIHSDLETFTKDFAVDNPEFGPGSQSAVSLMVTDRWARFTFTSVGFSILSQVGTQGPLVITTLELVGIEGGVAELRVVVQNTSATSVFNVALLATRVPPGGGPFTEPGNVGALAAGGSTEFSAFVSVDDLDTLDVQVQAFGQNVNGPVRSTPETTTVPVDQGPPAATTVSQGAAPGDDRVEVASNDGFSVNGFAQVGTGDSAETRRITGFGSLIFAAPLANPHALGDPVTEVDPPGGDRTPPVITVTSPTPSQLVATDAPLTLEFSCTDAGVGVEVCGGTRGGRQRSRHVDERGQAGDGRGLGSERQRRHSNRELHRRHRWRRRRWRWRRWSGGAPAGAARPLTCNGLAPMPFPDVETGSAHAASIGCAGALALLDGRADGTFGPLEELSRGQLATILLRALLSAGATVPTTGGGRFDDVDGTTHADAVNRLAAAGIVQGTGPRTFDPEGIVTRAQLMTILDGASARLLAAYPPVSGPAFDDTSGSVHEGAIDRLGAAGVATGLAPDGRSFGPARAVLRAHAASFLVRWMQDQATRVA